MIDLYLSRILRMIGLVLSAVYIYVLIFGMKINKGEEPKKTVKTKLDYFIIFVFIISELN